MKIILAVVLNMLCFLAFSQETLQSVTDRGAVTSNVLSIEGAELSGGYARFYNQGQMVSFIGTDHAAFGQGSNDAIVYVYSQNNGTLPGKFHIATGNARRLTIDGDGRVGIGTLTPKELLSVNGRIRAKEVKVEMANWPDYVFDDSYKIRSLPQLEQFIILNKHLPGIPCKKEIQTDGLAIGEMNSKLLQKIEELTLYIIEQDKRIQRLESLIISPKE